MKKYFDVDNRFAEVFDEKTGFYFRTGILDADLKDTGIDPFMRNYPSLIDVGIMGHCAHGQSGLCAYSGVECYQNGAYVNHSNMPFEDFKTLVDQAKGKVFQFALGGRGDANKHKEFEDILKYATENGIVCNYTTSGLQLTEREARLTKEYCGACAVSEYRSVYTDKAIQLLVKNGVKTNLHYVLSNSSIDEAITRLKRNTFQEGLNAVIFLLHKPVGMGSIKNVLSPSDPKVKEFFETVDKMNFNFKIGFDSCSCSGIVNFTKNIVKETIEPCEAAKHSMYIDADMNAMPCSFCNQDNSQFVNLHEYTIEDAWFSNVFENFRTSTRIACPTCPNKAICSPCPAMKNIQLCERKEFKQ